MRRRNSVALVLPRPTDKSPGTAHAQNGRRGGCPAGPRLPASGVGLRSGVEAAKLEPASVDAQDRASYKPMLPLRFARRPVGSRPTDGLAILWSRASGDSFLGVGRDAPACRVTSARLELDKPLAAAKSVRRAGHRLDGDAAPLDVGKAVAREDHQVRVALVGPEGRRARIYPRPTINLTLEVGEAMVELGRADSPRLAKSSPSSATDSLPTGMPRSSPMRTVAAGTRSSTSLTTSWSTARYGCERPRTVRCRIRRSSPRSARLDPRRRASTPRAAPARTGSRAAGRGGARTPPGQPRGRRPTTPTSV